MSLLSHLFTHATANQAHHARLVVLLGGKQYPVDSIHLRRDPIASGDGEFQYAITPKVDGIDDAAAPAPKPADIVPLPEAPAAGPASSSSAAADPAPAPEANGVPIAAPAAQS